MRFLTRLLTVIFLYSLTTFAQDTTNTNHRPTSQRAKSASINSSPLPSPSPAPVPSLEATSATNEAEATPKTAEDSATSGGWLERFSGWAERNSGIIIGAIITGLITYVAGRAQTKNSSAATINSLSEQLRSATRERDALQKEHDSLQSETASVNQHVRELEEIAKKYKYAKEKLESSMLVRYCYQPVILAGPRYVGKTSLMMQWHTPWETVELIPATVKVKVGEVPLYYFSELATEPHFAMPEISVRVETHLVLKVFDFPGEPSAQPLIRETAIAETKRLRQESRKNLGVVIILMFDAEEAVIGISAETLKYYNGDLFNELRELVSTGKIHIERLILVFNKYDKLKAHFPDSKHDRELLNLCIDEFEPIFKVMRGVCNQEKVCEVFTVVSRVEMHLKNRGAPIVKGEAARAFVEAFAGRAAAAGIIEQPATTYSAKKFAG